MKPHILLLCTALLAGISFTACRKSTECQNGGSLDLNGNCQCAEGYTGMFCENEYREQYCGTFQGDFSTLYGEEILENPYTVTIEKNAYDVTRVSIAVNKPPFDEPLLGIANEHYLHIPLQTVYGKNLSGSITRYASGISMNIMYDGFDYFATLGNQ